MKNSLSLLMITKNSEELLEKSLISVFGLVDEIVIIDDYSSDKTIEIAKKFGAKIYFNKERDLGKQRAFGLKKVRTNWVLVLDSDEIISKELKEEIKELLVISYQLLEKYSGFYIPFQNHFLGRELKYGGEDYKKLILFKKDSVKIYPSIIHEKFELKRGKLGYLKNKIYHYSYRSLWQMYKKFTDYAFREAEQKIKNGEKTSLKKIFLYPLHMFWARFVESKGYKDGLFRIPLDLGFAYMEFLTYILMLFIKPKSLNIKQSLRFKAKV